MRESDGVLHNTRGAAACGAAYMPVVSLSACNVVVSDSVNVSVSLCRASVTSVELHWCRCGTQSELKVKGRKGGEPVL